MLLGRRCSFLQQQQGSAFLEHVLCVPCTGGIIVHQAAWPPSGRRSQPKHHW